MSLDAVKAHFEQNLTWSRDAYIRDIEELSEATFKEGAGPNARKPIDFTYEVSYVNRRFATRLRGEDPGPWPVADGEWMTAPAGFDSKEIAVKAVRESMDELLEAFKAVPADEITKSIPLPNGETSALDLASSCYMHNAYHDAQLNYVQSLSGDMAMHWRD